MIGRDSAPSFAPHFRAPTSWVPLFLSAALFATGCTKQVSIEYLETPGVDLSKHHTIGVAGFQGQNGQDVSRLIETALGQAKSGKQSYFTIVDRDRLESVMKEQRLSLTGAIDPSRLKDVGKVLSLDALVTGNVASYEVRDSSYSENRSESYECGKKKTCSRDYTVGCTKREAYVQLNISVLDTETAQNDAPLSPEGRASSEKCSDQSSTLTMGEELLRAASQQAITEFVNQVTPHKVSERVMVKSGDDDAPLLFGSASDSVLASTMGKGVDLANAGLWAEAVTQFEDAVRQKPTCAACHYDLGLAMETLATDLSDLQTARDHYHQAVTSRPSDASYTGALKRIDRRISQWEELKRQTEEREAEAQRAREAEQAKSTSKTTKPAKKGTKTSK